MTSRTIGDSTALADIPLSVDVVATYVNGTYAVTLDQAHARFDPARYGHCRIDVNGTHADTAWVLDVEAGDAIPELAAEWIASWHKLHPSDGLPVIYHNRATTPQVEQQCGKPGGTYLAWIATLDASQVTGPGIAACQWKGSAQTGGHWDESLLYDANLWLPTRAPVAAPTLAQARAGMTVVAGYLEAAK